jgi:hypothetical protein
MAKEIVVAYFKILAHNFPKETYKTNENLMSHHQNKGQNHKKTTINKSFENVRTTQNYIHDEFKVKLSLVLNFALRHVEVLGKRGITPRILNLDNGWG